LPEGCSISVPAVINSIYRSAVPAQKYLPERRSAAFRHHYTPGYCATLHPRRPTTRRQALFHLFYQQLRINVPLLAETFILDDDCSVLEDTEYFAHHSYTLHTIHTLNSKYTMSDFNFWISLSLSEKTKRKT